MLVLLTKFTSHIVICYFGFGCFFRSLKVEQFEDFFQLVIFRSKFPCTLQCQTLAHTCAISLHFPHKSLPAAPQNVEIILLCQERFINVACNIPFQVFDVLLNVIASLKVYLQFQDFLSACHFLIQISLHFAAAADTCRHLLHLITFPTQISPGGAAKCKTNSPLSCFPGKVH